jgi:hypothetical protein
MLNESDVIENEKMMTTVDIADDNLIINESIQSLLDNLQNKLNSEE